VADGVGGLKTIAEEEENGDQGQQKRGRWKRPTDGAQTRPQLAEINWTKRKMMWDWEILAYWLRAN
jgi:hypothetical protein